MTATMKLLGAKSSGFDVLSLTPALWLDASDASTITASSGAVSQWSDKSGNTRHFTQSGSGKPVTGTRTQNGLNVIDFTSSSSQFLDGGDILDMGTGAWTCFSVVAFDTANGYGPWGKNVSGSDSGRYGLFRDGGRLYVASKVGADGGGSVSVADSSTAARVITGVYQRTGSAVLKIRVNGSQTSSTTWTDDGANRDTTAPWRVGRYGTSGLYFDGIVAEIILVMRTATSDEITATESYLASKWGT